MFTLIFAKRAQSKQQNTECSPVATTCTFCTDIEITRIPLQIDFKLVLIVECFHGEEFESKWRLYKFPAHESIVGGHMGIKKTTDKIQSAFYWPGIQGDVTRYCKSCDVCQKTVNKGSVPKVPLEKMPLIDKLFKRVTINLVGAIGPPSEDGHTCRYTVPLETMGPFANVIGERDCREFTAVGRKPQPPQRWKQPKAAVN